uniref:Uncharacterized protein n=1 Tax=Vitis vinifera TaxID=29760 RepID=A5BUU2_VITVI|nr:hypothetical protein VITISV_009560 [Vitis vinifera]
MRAPAPTVPSTGPMPDVAPSASPATPETLPVVPSTSEPPHPSESSVAISIFEFRGLCHTLQTLTTSQSILTQHMIALRATRSILSPPKPSILPSLGRYSSTWGPPLAEQTMPPEEQTIGEIEPSIPSIPTSTAEPSSPCDPPTTIWSST